MREHEVDRCPHREDLGRLLVGHLHPVGVLELLHERVQVERVRLEVLLEAGGLDDRAGLDVEPTQTSELGEQLFAIVRTAVASGADPESALRETARAFRKNMLGLMRQAGKKIALDVTQDRNDTNWYSTITRIPAARPDLVIVSISAGQAANFVKQYAEAGITVPLFSDYPPPPRIFERQVGAQAGKIGLVRAAFFLESDSNTPAQKDFVGKLKARVQKDLGEAHLASAKIKFFYDWNFQEAEQEIKRVLVLIPNNADAHGFWSDRPATRPGYYTMVNGFPPLRPDLPMPRDFRFDIVPS